MHSTATDFLPQASHLDPFSVDNSMLSTDHNSTLLTSYYRKDLWLQRIRQSRSSDMQRSAIRGLLTDAMLTNVRLVCPIEEKAL